MLPSSGRQTFTYLKRADTEGMACTTQMQERVRLSDTWRISIPIAEILTIWFTLSLSNLILLRETDPGLPRESPPTQRGGLAYEAKFKIKIVKTSLTFRIFTAGNLFETRKRQQLGLRREAGNIVGNELLSCMLCQFDSPVDVLTPVISCP